MVLGAAMVLLAGRLGGASGATKSLLTATAGVAASIGAGVFASGTGAGALGCRGRSVLGGVGWGGATSGWGLAAGAASMRRTLIGWGTMALTTALPECRA